MQYPAGPPTAEDEAFELLALLGIGGFAQTHKARVIDESLAAYYRTDIVALKIPLSRKKQRVLQRELELNAMLHLRLRDLQSANIVRYLGFEIFRSQLVMAMEFVPEGNLRRMIGDIGRQKRMRPDDAVAIIDGVLAGLSIIHAEHIFHRDIKPENILLEGKTPKIADLGISRMLDTNELASTAAGTIFYMSPEILSDEGASFPADIWSVGVTLYEMVTGRLPFGGADTPIGTMADLIRRANSVPACEICEIPQGLSDVIATALKRDPKNRFATADEMRLALARSAQQKDAKFEEELEKVRVLIFGTEHRSDAEEKLLLLRDRHPREPRVYQYIGEFYNRCQRYGEAIDSFRRGLEISPENALLHWDVALSYQRRGQNKEAAASLRKAVSLGLDPSLQRHAATLLKVLEGGRT
jgi:serine/threonine protein kinase